MSLSNLLEKKSPAFAMKSIEVLIEAKKHFLRPKQWVGHPNFANGVSCSKGDVQSLPVHHDRCSTG